MKEKSRKEERRERRWGEEWEEKIGGERNLLSNFSFFLLFSFIFVLTSSSWFPLLYPLFFPLSLFRFPYQHHHYYLSLSLILPSLTPLLRPLPPSFTHSLALTHRWRPDHVTLLVFVSFFSLSSLLIMWCRFTRVSLRGYATLYTCLGIRLHCPPCVTGNASPSASTGVRMSE